MHARNARSVSEKIVRNSKTRTKPMKSPWGLAINNREDINDTISDEYCPHCDNHYVLDAKTPAPTLKVEGEDARVDARMLKDDRKRPDQQRSIFDVKEAAEKLG